MARRRPQRASPRTVAPAHHLIVAPVRSTGRAGRPNSGPAGKPEGQQNTTPGFNRSHVIARGSREPVKSRAFSQPEAPAPLGACSPPRKGLPWRPLAKPAEFEKEGKRGSLFASLRLRSTRRLCDWCRPGGPSHSSHLQYDTRAVHPLSVSTFACVLRSHQRCIGTSERCATRRRLRSERSRSPALGVAERARHARAERRWQAPGSFKTQATWPGDDAGDGCLRDRHHHKCVVPGRLFCQARNWTKPARQRC